ncbi:MAG: type secretion rane fusion protein, HlyD family [Geobacteraceae bacterium]|nr:type secretion rane fusion protein, HlyD family [Geobacteraceae bacterium]
MKLALQNMFISRKDTNPCEFSPPLLRLQESPPNPAGRKILWVLLAVFAALMIWVLFGRLDIVVTAEGKLVPQSYVKIVQPAEAGIVKEILVREGEEVRAGQVLMRMDARITEADARSLESDLQRKRLTLRRIDAEISGRPFRPGSQDSPSLAREIESRHLANRAALEAALAEERSRLVRARHELSAAEQVRKKLADILPHYRRQDQAFEELSQGGFIASLTAGDKRRERIEKEQELRTQEQVIESARASILQSVKKLALIESDYRRQLHAERGDIQGQADKLAQEVAKQEHRKELMELKAKQDGVVKDLATHSAGTVVQPGTVLLTLVPRGEALRAEVWISNEDIGFIRKGQQAKLKFAAFPFQKYGMVEGTIEHLSADAEDNAAAGSGGSSTEQVRKGSLPVYRALVALKSMALEMNGKRFSLSAGMQTKAEFRLGDRTVLEYLLSPVRKVCHEAGRER